MWKVLTGQMSVFRLSGSQEESAWSSSKQWSFPPALQFMDGIYGSVAIKIWLPLGIHKSTQHSTVVENSIVTANRVKYFLALLADVCWQYGFSEAVFCRIWVGYVCTPSVSCICL